MIRSEIEQAVREALAELGAPEVPFTVERPADLAHGDYATNAALAAAKALKKNPKEVADLLMNLLMSKSLSMEKMEVAGAGFINFFLSRDAIANEIETAAKEPEWASTSIYGSKKVMVEYTDPNPFKEFHIGHLMTNVLGESVACTLENAGAKVMRANYQGDVGLHVAKAIWGYKKMKEDPNFKESGYRTKKPWEKEKDFEVHQWGIAYQIGNAEYERPDSGAKIEIDAINKQVYEKSNEQINKLYAQGREESLAHFEELYKLLGTKFDKYYFESESTPLGLSLVHNHPEVFEESDGACVYRGEDEGLHTRVFLTSQGLPTYEAKDLGLLELKSKESLDVSITVTASEQKDYFKVVLAAAKRLSEVKDIAEKTQHVTHGMMRFASGKMSSRLGNVITGESLLRSLTEAAKEKMQGRELPDADEVAAQVAVGAIKYAVLKQSSGKDIVFNPEQSLSLEGDSGPYLQYAHTRALSLLKNAGREGAEPGTSDKPEEAGALERLLIHYPDVVERAARELEPHHITTYLTELASSFNSWYASERVLGSEHQAYGVLLTQAVEQTLKKGLRTLGIPAPEQM